MLIHQRPNQLAGFDIIETVCISGLSKLLSKLSK